MTPPIGMAGHPLVWKTIVHELDMRAVSGRGERKRHPGRPRREFRTAGQPPRDDDPVRRVDFETNTPAGAVTCVEVVKSSGGRIHGIELIFDRVAFAPVNQVLNERANAATE